MDKIEKSSPCSPYLQRPLRSLDQAMKDQADDSPANHAPLIRSFDLSTLLAGPRKEPIG